MIYKTRKERVQKAEFIPYSENTSEFDFKDLIQSSLQPSR